VFWIRSQPVNTSLNVVTAPTAFCVRHVKRSKCVPEGKLRTTLDVHDRCLQSSVVDDRIQVRRNVLQYLQWQVSKRLFCIFDGSPWILLGPRHTQELANLLEPRVFGLIQKDSFVSCFGICVKVFNVVSYVVVIGVGLVSKSMLEGEGKGNNEVQAGARN
jgi:hypothetical protein